jgi:hypothetical protein
MPRPRTRFARLTMTCWLTAIVLLLVRFKTAGRPHPNPAPAEDQTSGSAASAQDVLRCKPHPL